MSALRRVSDGLFHCLQVTHGACKSRKLFSGLRDAEGTGACQTCAGSCCKRSRHGRLARHCLQSKIDMAYREEHTSLRRRRKWMYLTEAQGTCSP